VTAQNQEMIDNIQEVGVALSDLALELQSLAFKNSAQVEAMYSTILPIIEKIPKVGRRVTDASVVRRSNDLSRQIVTLTGGWRTVIVDIRQALVVSNPTVLRKYLVELKRIRKRVRLGRPFAPRVPCRGREDRAQRRLARACRRAQRHGRQGP
jgi:hypothetical protein